MFNNIIFVTGGVVSSLGKGLAAASIGCLLESHGFNISMVKLDPYLNVDPGTMSPFQHGEVFVTDDGAETDLDLGHYERFTSINTKKINNITAGQIYRTVISRERRGGYLGKTVQVIPHVTDEIKDCLEKVLKTDKPDILICEIGGTIGDIESLPFLEAIRQLSLVYMNTIHIHTTLVPYIAAAKELKTKPTQHSVRELRAIGITPDIILCRTSKNLPEDLKSKISLFCNIKKSAVITARDAKIIYEVPILFEKEGLDDIIIKELNLTKKKNKNFDSWKDKVNIIKNYSNKEVNIGIVGKYTNLQDSYKSLAEALYHGGVYNNVNININWISTNKDNNIMSTLSENIDGILVPGGFGDRGLESKIKAVNYARINKIPFLGICLGMQCAVIEFARNVLDMKEANSTEFFKKTPYPVISLLEEQENIEDYGGTMRLGSYPCTLTNKVADIYGLKEIHERHRHRYEFNKKYLSFFEKNGMIASGLSLDKSLVEIVELQEHPWFIGCQFHPEFKSRFMYPHPLFISFVSFIKKYKNFKKKI